MGYMLKSSWDKHIQLPMKFHSTYDFVVVYNIVKW